MSDWFLGDSPLIIGHRGASADAPENSFSSFALAIDQGADGIELDVQLSADGGPVIMHDRTVDRTSNGRGAVSELTVSQLQELDAGDGRPIPTLDQLFEMFGPSLLYNIELKSTRLGDSALVAAVAERVEGHQLENRILLSSFNPFVIRQCRREMSATIPLALIRNPGIQKYVYLVADGMADHPHYTMVNNKYMSWAKTREYRVHVWTVDEPAEARRLVNLGVNAIITNVPKILRESLPILE